MRKILPFILFTLVTIQFGYSQITITTSDMPIVSDVIITYTDTLAGVENTPGNSGAGQTWDYSGISNHYSTTSSFYAPSATPYAANFPSSNIAMSTDTNVYIFMNSSASLVTVEGIAGTILNPGDLIYINPAQTMYQLPLTYGNNYSDNYLVNYEGDGASLGVYRVKLVRHGNIIDTADAYGTLKTPMGTYNSLRIKRLDYTIDSVFIKLTMFSPWDLAQNGTDTNLTYNWLANGGKLPIIQMSTDGAGNTTNMTYSAMPGTFGIEQVKQPVVIVGPNPFTEYISLTIPEEFSSGDLILLLTDINGKIVMNKTLSYNNQLSLDLSFLESGMYLFTIRSNNYSYSGKIVKR